MNTSCYESPLLHPPFSGCKMFRFIKLFVKSFHEAASDSVFISLLIYSFMLGSPFHLPADLIICLTDQDHSSISWKPLLLSSFSPR